MIETLVGPVIVLCQDGPVIEPSAPVCPRLEIPPQKNDHMPRKISLNELNESSQKESVEALFDQQNAPRDLNILFLK